MRILGIYDRADGGGAAIAANRVLLGLKEMGADVARVVWDNPTEAFAVTTEVAHRDPFPNRLERLVNRIAPVYGNSSLVRDKRVIRRFKARVRAFKPDVINIHNIHGSEWPLEIVRFCADTCPTVWTLHDMWSFTGRCGYSFECQAYLTLCDDKCPTPDEYPKLAPAKISTAYGHKQELLHHTNTLSAVTPSRWLKEKALEGLWKNRRVELIPYGLEHVQVRKSSSEVRKELGIPPDSRVLITVAADLSEKRKGGHFLLDMMERLDISPKVHWILIGKNPPSGTFNSVVPVKAGFLSSRQALHEILSAADLFVHPAPVDNLPNVVIESLAAGVPVLGFETGGVPDMVRPGVTGWLAREINSDSMLSELEAILRTWQPGRLSENCRDVAKNEYTLEVQARRYMELFEDLLSAA